MQRAYEQIDWEVRNSRLKRIILGSASPRRRELLEQIGITFEIVTSGKDEVYNSTIPAEIVKELAQMKAENVSEEVLEKEGRLCDVVVIGADTIVVRDGEILGKPADEEDAFHMLKSLQGRAHQVYTGVAILDFDENGVKNVTSHAERTEVFMCAMPDAEIEKYIASGEPMDKAGAYGIQGRFAAFIERIEGDYFNVVGFPLAYVYSQLKHFTEI